MSINISFRRRRECNKPYVCNNSDEENEEYHEIKTSYYKKNLIKSGKKYPRVIDREEIKGSGWKFVPRLPYYHEGTDKVKPLCVCEQYFEKKDSETGKIKLAVCRIYPLAPNNSNKKLYEIDASEIGHSLKPTPILYKINIAAIEEYQNDNKIIEIGSLIQSHSVFNKKKKTDETISDWLKHDPENKNPELNIKSKINLKSIKDFILNYAKKFNLVGSSKKNEKKIDDVDSDTSEDCYSDDSEEENDLLYNKDFGLKNNKEGEFKDSLISSKIIDVDKKTQINKNLKSNLINESSKRNDTESDDENIEHLWISFKHLDGKVVWYNWVKIVNIKNSNIPFEKKKQIVLGIKGFLKSNQESSELFNGIDLNV